MVRVLIVEDSDTAADLLAAVLESDPDLRVVGRARTGDEGVAKAEALHPDVITMDVSLPGIDGHEATRRIMRRRPTPIVVVSGTVDPDSVRASMDALASGALAVLAKPSGPAAVGFDEAKRRITSTVKAMAGLKVVRQHTRPRPAKRVEPTASDMRDRIVAIAASTGGPSALRTLLAALPAGFPAPILVVQHITEGFVDGFVRWLDTMVDLRVKVAESGEPIAPGTVYVAPEGFHLGVTAAHVRLSDDAPVRGFRPSATSLFRSVARAYRDGALAVVLTGMGEDGVEGLRDVHAAGGRVIAQDEATSVVYGMPAAAVAAGVVDAVLPVHAIPERLCHLLGETCPA